MSSPTPMHGLLRDALAEEERRLSDLEARVQRLVARAGGDAAGLEEPKPRNFAPPAEAPPATAAPAEPIRDDIDDDWNDLRGDVAPATPLVAPRPRGFPAAAPDDGYRGADEDEDDGYRGADEDEDDGYRGVDEDGYRSAADGFDEADDAYDGYRDGEPATSGAFRSPVEGQAPALRGARPPEGAEADDSQGWGVLEEALAAEDSDEDAPLVGHPPGAWDEARDAELEDPSSVRFAESARDWDELAEATRGVVEDAVAGVVEDDVPTEEGLPLPPEPEETARFVESPSWEDLAEIEELRGESASPAAFEEPRPRGFGARAREPYGVHPAPESALHLDPEEEALMAQARQLIAESGSELADLERRLEALQVEEPEPEPAELRPEASLPLPPDPHPRNFAPGAEQAARHDLGRAFGAAPPPLERLVATQAALLARLEDVEEHLVEQQDGDVRGLVERLERRLNALEDRLEEAFRSVEDRFDERIAALDERLHDVQPAPGPSAREVALEARAKRAEERFFETVRQLSQTTELVGRMTARLEELSARQQEAAAPPPPAEPGTTQHLIRLLRSGPVVRPEAAPAPTESPSAARERPNEEGQARLLEAVEDHRDLLREHARLLDRLVRRLDP